MFVSKYQMASLGIELPTTAGEANMLFITGPLTARSESFFLKTLAEIKPPFVVISAGTCAVSCGIFRDSYPIRGPVDKYTTVDVTVAGCPPRPQAMAEAIAKAIEILKRKIEGEDKQELQGDKSEEFDLSTFTVPETFRGKIKVDPSICTACRTCEVVCPSGAIKISEDENGFTHTVWNNSCCYCGTCAYYCPTGAIRNTNDADTVRTHDEKYTHTAVSRIEYNRCDRCDKKYIRASSPIIKKTFSSTTENRDIIEIMCPDCRKEMTFERLYT
jgi:Ni,Fe-hydrogenase III small subunit/NAD-dependent dihydropyrimidine dehydrogenase PreA subunit